MCVNTNLYSVYMRAIYRECDDYIHNILVRDFSFTLLIISNVIHSVCNCTILLSYTTFYIEIAGTKKVK